jgi:hypothetical protein
MTLDLKSPERRARAAVAGNVLVDVAHEADVAVLRQELGRAPISQSRRRQAGLRRL